MTFQPNIPLQTALGDLISARKKEIRLLEKLERLDLTMKTRTPSLLSSVTTSASITDDTVVMTSWTKTGSLTLIYFDDSKWTVGYATEDSPHCYRPVPEFNLTFEHLEDALDNFVNRLKHFP